MSLIDFKNRTVNLSNIKIGGIDMDDYPDFCDAYIEYAEYEDGTQLSPDELDEFQSENAYLVNELIHDQQLYI